MKATEAESWTDLNRLRANQIELALYIVYIVAAISYIIPYGPV